MQKKAIMVFAAALALGAATMATGAIAQQRGHAGGGRPGGGPSVGAMRGPSPGAMRGHGAGPRFVTRGGPAFRPGPSVAFRGPVFRGRPLYRRPALAFRGPVFRGRPLYRRPALAFRGRRFIGGLGGLYAFGGSWWGNPWYNSCYQRRLIPTRFGLRWRSVWVC
jgi:hypothetical protein